MPPSQLATLAVATPPGALQSFDAGPTGVWLASARAPARAPPGWWRVSK